MPWPDLTFRSGYAVVEFTKAKNRLNSGQRRIRLAVVNRDIENQLIKFFSIVVSRNDAFLK